MGKILSFVKDKATFVVSVSVAAVVGAAGSAVVMAAIPDSNGRINACYKNSTQVLRVTDPAGNCSNNETPLSWSQDGGSSSQTAYAAIAADGSALDAAYSKNVLGFKLVPDPNNFPDSSGQYHYAAVCFQIVFNPHAMVVSLAGGGTIGSQPTAFDGNNTIAATCGGSQYNADIQGVTVQDPSNPVELTNERFWFFD